MNLLSDELKWRDAAEYGREHFTTDAEERFDKEEKRLFKSAMTPAESRRINDLLKSIELPSRTENLLLKEGKTADQIMKSLVPLINPKRPLLRPSGITGLVRTGKIRAERLKVKSPPRRVLNKKKK